MKVMIADDSQAVVERVWDLLREVDGIELAGHTATPQETSRQIDKLHPDILILDLELQDGSGLPVLGTMKRNYPRAAVIILTNNAALAIREKCLLAGADFFLDKSNEFDRLPQIVRSLAHRGRSSLSTGVNSEQRPRLV